MLAGNTDTTKPYDNDNVDAPSANEGQDDDYDQEETNDRTDDASQPAPRPKLPSFKKRQREDNEESGEKIDLSEEIRMQKQKRARTEDDAESEEQVEVDPQQGTLKLFWLTNAFMQLTATIVFSFAGRTGQGVCTCTVIWKTKEEEGRRICM
jgi:hypothetical protein